MPTQYPRVNGTFPDWASIEIKIGADVFVGVTDISYKDPLTPARVYGTHPQPLVETRGMLEPEGSITLLHSEYRRLLATLGTGYKEKFFLVIVNYSDGADTYTDELQGCRIKDDDMSHSQGSDPLKVTCALSVLRIIRNGLDSIASPLAGAPAG